MSAASAISVENRIDSVLLGVVRTDGIKCDYEDEAFERRLALLLTERAAGLSEIQDAVRRSARDMLRNGTYKPTGRGKPASEYLLRASQAGETFPRINWPVDVCSLISLASLLPVSIWDTDSAGTRRFVFRLGTEDESYAFNSAGQVIELHDLVVGCALPEDDRGGGQPIVNPVKDSVRTKTTASSRNVMACIYAPASDFEAARLLAICNDFATMLSLSHPSSKSSIGVVRCGETVTC